MKVKLCGCSERKASARTFVANNHKYAHIWTSVDDHIRGQGVCSLHGQPRKKDSHTCTLNSADKKCDVVCAGIPCHPFTTMRQSNIVGSDHRGKAAEHADFGTVMDKFPLFLQERNPGMFVVEETETFANINPATNERYIDEFTQKCKRLGYDTLAMVVAADTWIDWPRNRSLRQNIYPLQHLCGHALSCGCVVQH